MTTSGGSSSLTAGTVACAGPRRLEPDEPEIYVALGRVELGKGNTKAANKLFEQARRKSEPRTFGFQMLLEKKIERLMAASDQSESTAQDP